MQRVRSGRKLSIICLALNALVFALYVSAQAQQPKRTYRVGYLSPRLGIDSRAEAFRQGLVDLGYIEGQNLVIEWRFVKGKTDLFPEFAAELVHLKMDCILAVGVSAIGSLKKLTRTIPIVMGTIDADPVEQGFIASLAQPGGNITGFTAIAYDLAGKRLLEVRRPEELDNAFQAARQGRAQVLSVVTTGLINSHRPRIINLAATSRLPTMYSSPDFVAEGGLMSYASDPVAQHRRAAIYVDKILKGAKPADLPVEQAKKFEFIINLKAAKQIGLTIPPNVLARADRVIR